MRRTLFLLGLSCILASPAAAQIVPPAPGVEIPPDVIRSINEKGADTFQFRHAWIAKTQRTRETREAYQASHGFYQRDMVPAAERSTLAVTGNFEIPVFCVKYSDTGADPFPTSELQTRLFDGPYSPQTLNQFYNEISYGDISVSGTVYGWTPLPNPGSYYAGAGTCDGLCGTANIGDLILTTLNANDGTVDFGQYDNDGPDGVPNSGDDDGFVDFVAFVQPQEGAECGVDGKIWSHRSSLTNHTGTAYSTNDARSGGGQIKVDDYVIQPAFNCGGSTVIDIGVFCHEFGHAFGLPDLYDVNGGSQGIGNWGLMGTGVWNTTDNPAHMCAWSKNQLGWADVVVVDADPTGYSIANVEFNRTIYRLDVTNERWRRSTDCKIAGNYSMKCGLTAAEATLRNWVSDAGYGNRWDEAVTRDFDYSGTGPVSLSYQVSYELEPNYDYCYGMVTSGGNTSTFVTYTGTGSGTANFDITPYLNGAGPYEVRFRMTSDVAWSDEDGLNPTTCGAFVFDDFTVTDNGATVYSTNFEAREDGWAQLMPPVDEYYLDEYFLVENRQPLGSDVALYGGGGLAVWHIERAVASTGQSGNTGGSTNTQPRGVALVQADGLSDLENNINRGDAGDPYPGSTTNTLFDGTSTPTSNGYDRPSHASVQVLNHNGDPIPVIMTGGWPAPAIGTLTPNTGASGTTVVVQIDGSDFARTGTAMLSIGRGIVPATSVEWVGKNRILATFDLTGVANGFYDVLACNPGGACGAATAAFEVTDAPTGIGDRIPKQTVLRANYPNPFNPSTTILFDLATRAAVTLRVYDVSGALVRTLVNEERDAGSYAVEWHGRNDQGNVVSSGVYFYRLSAGSFSDVRKMTLVK